VVFTVRFSNPTNQIAEVEAKFPTEGRSSIELMIPVWSPGFYHVEDYAKRVEGFSARSLAGAVLAVDKPRTNRWRIQTGGARAVLVSYRLSCRQRTVTGNSIGEDLAVLNGPPSFITFAKKGRRPHEVRLEMAPGWERSMTALDPAPDGQPNHYRAEDYNTLADSPILAGKLSVHEFAVAGTRYCLVDAGEISTNWDGAVVAKELEKLVQENYRFWGVIPFKRFVFLNVFRRGAGGLEHANSTLLTSSPNQSFPPPNSWLTYVCHEYLHAYNVKRLRPAELEVLDYELPPRTRGLWVSEGLTVYYDIVLTARAGASTQSDALSSFSSEIERLQSAQGRLVQSLEQASLEVWNTPTSGIPRDTSTNTVSYYTKGPVVGFLLDARIQAATGRKKSLDDVMRLAYQRYSGAHGFTSEQFGETVEEVGGADVRRWLKQAVSTAGELDYTQALDWYGLEFGRQEGAKKKWRLEVRSNATQAQLGRLQRWVGPSMGQH
jgi:predicted metalloprotease with PDZ domain